MYSPVASISALRSQRAHDESELNARRHLPYHTYGVRDGIVGIKAFHDLNSAVPILQRWNRENSGGRVLVVDASSTVRQSTCQSHAHASFAVFGMPVVSEMVY